METQLSENLKAVILEIHDEKYLVDVEYGKEIYVPGDKIIPIPLASKSIIGIIDVRGDIYSIISLKYLIYGEGSDDILNENSRLILIEFNNLKIGLLVDSVIGVQEFSSSFFKQNGTIVKTNIDYSLIKLIGVMDDEAYILLDLNALFQSYTTLLESTPQNIPSSLPKVQPSAMTSGDRIRSTSKTMPKPLEEFHIKVRIPEEKFAITKTQQEILQEIGNIGCGNAVTALSRLIKKKIDVNLTDVGIISFDKLSEQFGGTQEKVCGIFCHILDPSQSTILQIFEMKPLLKLVSSLVGKKSKIDPNKISTKNDLDEFAVSTITEMGNILAGHYASALSDLTGTKMMIDVPEFTMTSAGLLGEFLSEELSAISKYIIIIKTAIKITDYKLTGVFFFIPDINTLKSLFEKLGVIYEPKGLEENYGEEPIALDFDEIKLTELQRDALKEIGNIGAGNAANALAKMINKRVDINIPSVEMVELDKFASKISKKNEKLLVAWSNITGKTRATILSIFDISDIIDLTSLIVEDKDKKQIDLRKKINSVQDFPELYRSAMSELGHILGSHYISAIGNLLAIRLMTEPPDMSIDTGSQLFDILREEIGILKKLSLVITTNVIIKDFKITGTFLFIPNLETFQHLLDALSKFYE